MHMAISPLQRLDDFRLSERCAQDAVAEAISLHLYHRHYDQLPRDLRSRVEGAAFRALRSPQGAWMSVAWMRAHKNLDRVMAEEMGPVYGMVAPQQREALARIGVQVVIAALLGVLEIGNPFDGPGQALQVYDAADAAAKEVR